MSVARILTLASLLGLARFGPAQTIDDGYNNLRQASTDIQLTVTGTDTRNGGTRYRAELSYRDLGNTQPVEVVEYSGKLSIPDASLPLTRRLVGDGTTMWAYNQVRNDYTALRYGVYKGAVLGTYRMDFFHALSAAENATSAPVIRLLNDLFSDQVAPTYRPWFSGPAVPVLLSDKNASDVTPIWGAVPHDATNGYRDPVLSSRSYLPTDATNSPTPVNFQTIFEPKLSRFMSFQLQQDTATGNWQLTDIYSAQRYGSGDIAEWHIAVTATPAIPANAFTFIPPQSARALVGRVGG